MPAINFVHTFLLLCRLPANAQFGIGSKHIHGTGPNDKPAPQGVLVILDRSRGRDSVVCERKR